MRQDFAVDGPLETDVRLGIGRVDAERADAGSAWASVEPVNPGHEPSVRLAAQATISLDGARLRVHLPDSIRTFRKAEVAVTLGLPARSTLAVKGGAVDVTVTGGVDELAVKIGAGDVEVDEASTAVAVKAGQTEVRIGTAAAVVITTGQGSLTAEQVGDTAFKTGQGSVHLGRTSGAVAVKGGQVDLEIREAEAGDVSFITGSGSAGIGVAAGTTVELDLLSGSGDVRCDLPMESSAPSGGAGLRLKLRTGSGDLRVATAVQHAPSAGS